MVDSDIKMQFISLQNVNKYSSVSKGRIPCEKMIRAKQRNKQDVSCGNNFLLVSGHWSFVSCQVRARIVWKQ